MKWNGLEMDWGDNKFNCLISQTFNPTNFKTMIEEVCKITGTNDMPMILCNPIDYEFAKEALKRNNLYCNIIKSPYIEEYTITAITDEYTKAGILGFLKQKRLFNEE